MPSNRLSLLGKVQAILRDVLEGTEGYNGSVDPDDLKLDSMKTIQLIVRLESEFGFLFDDDDLMLDKFKTAELIVTLLEEKYGIGSDLLVMETGEL